MKRISILPKAGLLLGGVVAVCAANAAEKVDFNKQVLPVLQAGCVKCHGPEKQKAQLRLDSLEAVLKGGKHGPPVVAGNVSKSDLYKRLTLPADDDDAMPPKGKADRPAPAQIELIKAWIEQGAAK